MRFYESVYDVYSLVMLNFSVYWKAFANGKRVRGIIITVTGL